LPSASRKRTLGRNTRQFGNTRTPRARLLSCVQHNSRPCRRPTDAVASTGTTPNIAVSVAQTYVASGHTSAIGLDSGCPCLDREVALQVHAVDAVDISASRSHQVVGQGVLGPGDKFEGPVLVGK